MHSTGIISLLSLSLATDVTDVTLGASGLWLGTRTGASGTATLAKRFFWPQSMASWTTYNNIIFKEVYFTKLLFV